DVLAGVRDVSAPVPAGRAYRGTRGDRAVYREVLGEVARLQQRRSGGGRRGDHPELGHGRLPTIGVARLAARSVAGTGTASWAGPGTPPAPRPDAGAPPPPPVTRRPAGSAL